MNRSPLQAPRHYAKRHPLAAGHASLGLVFGAAVALLQAPSSVQAQSTVYTWGSATTGGSWTASPSNWTVVSGSGSTYPSQTTDTAYLGNATTNRSGSNAVTLGASESISSLNFVQTSAAVNELAIGGSSTTTLTLANALAIGGNTSGTELVYLDGIDNTKAGNLTDNSGITVGANGILELGTSGATGFSNPVVTGLVTVNTGGILNGDVATTSDASVQLNLASGLTLNGGTLNLGAANSHGTASAAGTTYNTRLIVSGNFLAENSAAVSVKDTSGSVIGTNNIYFSGGISTAQFNSGTTGWTTLTSILYTGTNTGSSAFALTSDVALPQLSITPTGNGTPAVTVSIGTVTPGGTLSVAGIGIGAPNSKTGTLELTLTSNVTLASGSNVSEQNQSAGSTFIFNTGGFVFDDTSHANFATTGFNNWTLEGGGTIKDDYFTLTGATVSSSVSGATTLLAVGDTTATTSNLNNANGGMIDPTSTFNYTGTSASGTENYLTSTRAIGRLLVGNGTLAATLGISTSPLTVGGDITVSANGILDLDGQNVTETHGATATAGGLNGAGTVLNGTTTTSNAATVTLTLDTTQGDGTFSGSIKNNSAGTGVVALTKNGTGTQTLSGANPYSGATQVNGGTLALNATNAVSATSGITVTNSTLSLIHVNALATPVTVTTTTGTITGQVPITLSGGTLLRNGTGVSLGSQSGTTGTVGVGMLTLTASSTIDFGTTGVGTLNFAGLATTTPLSSTNTLSIIDYSSTHPGVAGTDGTDDRIIFDQSVSSYLSDITLDGQTPTQVALGNGEFELIAQVPEPSTKWSGALLLALLGWTQIRRSRKTANAVSIV